PKFPTPVIFEFLIRYHLLTPAAALERVEAATNTLELNGVASDLRRMLVLGDDQGDVTSGTPISEFKEKLTSAVTAAEKEAQLALEMVEFTLQKIRRGGIHDHIGSGFHSFEKMLYDQAQLLSVFSEAYHLTNDEAYSEAATDIIRYVSRDLQYADGGFYSAEDADSLPTPTSERPKEGAFAVWERAEIESALGDNADLFCYHFGVQPTGNVSSTNDPHGELQGKNVLYMMHLPHETARFFRKTEEQVTATVADCLRKLWEVRQIRPKPHCDDKIITSWNGLMISALAKAARFLKSPEALALAERAAHFLRANLAVGDASELLWRSFRGGAASAVSGFADDYAFLVMGLLDLFEASGDAGWLRWAADLQESMDRQFWDAEHGGYYSGP
ncbi:hypothetical protein HK405_014538, partial [Cladochytrium tenue]